MCSRSSSRESVHTSSQRQPWQQGSWPASRRYAATSGLRSNATAAPKNVTGMPNSSNSRCRRQTPAAAAVLVDRLGGEVAELGSMT